MHHLALSINPKEAKIYCNKWNKIIFFSIFNLMYEIAIGSYPSEAIMYVA